MQIKRIYPGKTALFAAASALLLAWFSEGRLTGFSKVGSFDVYAYVFGGFAQIAQKFDVLHYTLLLLPFLLLIYLAASDLGECLVDARFLTAYRFHSMQKWLLWHSIPLLLRAVWFAAVFHASLLLAGMGLHREGVMVQWNAVFPLFCKQCFFTCAVSMLQMLLTLRRSLSVGVIGAAGLCGLALLVDFSCGLQSKLLLAGLHVWCAVGEALVLLLTILLLLLQPQKKLLSLIFS